MSRELSSVARKKRQRFALHFIFSEKFAGRQRILLTLKVSKLKLRDVLHWKKVSHRNYLEAYFVEISSSTLCT